MPQNCDEKYKYKTSKRNTENDKSIECGNKEFQIGEYVQQPKQSDSNNRSASVVASSSIISNGLANITMSPERRSEPSLDETNYLQPSSQVKSYDSIDVASVSSPVSGDTSKSVGPIDGGIATINPNNNRSSDDETELRLYVQSNNPSVSTDSLVTQINNISSLVLSIKSTESESDNIQTDSTTVNTDCESTIPLWRSPAFLLVCLSYTFYTIHYQSLFMNILNKADHAGISSDTSVWLYTVLGASAFVFRVIALTLIKINFTVLLYSAGIAGCIAAISSLLVPFMNTFPLLVVYCIVWGGSLGKVLVFIFEIQYFFYIIISA